MASVAPFLLIRLFIQSSSTRWCSTCLLLLSQRSPNIHPEMDPYCTKNMVNALPVLCFHRFRLGRFSLCFTSIFASGASRTRPRKVIQKCSQVASKMVPSSSKKGLLGPMLVYLGAMLATYGSKSALFGCILSLRLLKMVRR